MRYLLTAEERVYFLEYNQRISFINSNLYGLHIDFTFNDSSHSFTNYSHKKQSLNNPTTSNLYFINCTYQNASMILQNINLHAIFSHFSNVYQPLWKIGGIIQTNGAELIYINHCYFYNSDDGGPGAFLYIFQPLFVKILNSYFYNGTSRAAYGGHISIKRNIYTNPDLGYDNTSVFIDNCHFIKGQTYQWGGILNFLAAKFKTLFIDLRNTKIDDGYSEANTGGLGICMCVCVCVCVLFFFWNNVHILYTVCGVCENQKNSAKLRKKKNETMLCFCLFWYPKKQM